MRAWPVGLIGLHSPLLCAGLWSWRTYHLAEKGYIGPSQRPSKRVHQAVLCTAWKPQGRKNYHAKGQRKTSHQTFFALLAQRAENYSSVDSTHREPTMQNLTFSLLFTWALNKQSVKLIWYAMALIWRHHNVIKAAVYTVIHAKSQNRPNSQIPECTCFISHNAPFRTVMCKVFFFCMKHFEIWNRCILRFGKLEYWEGIKIYFMPGT